MRGCIMHLGWCEYDPHAMEFIESWLDADTIKSTGLEDGFRAFYEYWATEDGFVPGENFWCKVICEDEEPLAILACCQDDRKLIIMEFIVKPGRRGQGLGTRILKELVESEEILNRVFHNYEAVIYPSNIASQMAFEHAGFRYLRSHPDGGSMLYAYQ